MSDSSRHLLGSGSNALSKPGNSSICALPDPLIEEIFEYVDQFDLINCSTLSHRFYDLATKRLYRRVTVILNADFPTRYQGSSRTFVVENGIKYMDSSLILSYSSLLKFNVVLSQRPDLVDKVRFFIFDKCSSSRDSYPPSLPPQPTTTTTSASTDASSSVVLSTSTLNQLHTDVIEFFGKNAKSLNFLHITFIDFVTGVKKLNRFLASDNVRNKLFKLFVNKLDELHTPKLPAGLTNLFLMLDELELSEIDTIDLGSGQPYEVFNSLKTLTFSTSDHLGLDIIRKFKLRHGSKVKLKGLTVFHCHKDMEENSSMEDSILAALGGAASSQPPPALPASAETDDAPPSTATTSMTPSLSKRFEYLSSIDKHLRFDVLSSKIDICYLNQMYLKIDCFSDRNDSGCNCFQTFLEDLARFSISHQGLPNLESFELELFPNLEWLRPHQMLESILTPLGTFIKTLSSLSRLSIDFSTLGFKMFDNGIGMSSMLLNKLNERLMQAFFLCFFSTVTSSTSHDDQLIEGGGGTTPLSSNRVVSNLRSLQLPDFLTSFIYYKPDFYESFLHTCKCAGCNHVLERLEQQFFPLHDEEQDEDEEDQEGENALDLQSTFYLLIGFILGKLQADREVCIPIKKTTTDYRNYPIYKGQSHTLHHQFHKSEVSDCEDGSCKCSDLPSNPSEDPNGVSPLNIDNLVTIYIIHQLRPIVKYLTKIFYKLDTLMIHGVYYERMKDGSMRAIFDDDEYPQEILDKAQAKDFVPDVPFGSFKKIV